jgi:hypothetical protein
LGKRPLYEIVVTHYILGLPPQIPKSLDWFLTQDMDELASKNLEAFYWILQHRDEITRHIARV